MIHFSLSYACPSLCVCVCVCVCTWYSSSLTLSTTITGTRSTLCSKSNKSVCPMWQASKSTNNAFFQCTHDDFSPHQLCLYVRLGVQPLSPLFNPNFQNVTHDPAISKVRCLTAFPTFSSLELLALARPRSVSVWLSVSVPSTLTWVLSLLREGYTQGKIQNSTHTQSMKTEFCLTSSYVNVHLSYRTCSFFFPAFFLVGR